MHLHLAWLDAQQYRNTMRTTATRYHDFSAGHRVHGHESKCAHLHGHNYRVHFTVTADALDSIGRVMDFSAIKEHLCEWLEDNWDHRMLLWEKDPMAKSVQEIDPSGTVLVPFNPTAEAMAQYLVEVIAPAALRNTGVRLIRCSIDETRKCSATFELSPS